MRKSLQACEQIKKIKIPEEINVDYHTLGGEPVDVGEYPHQVGERKIFKMKNLCKF